MRARSPQELKAYIDGYNACFKQYTEILDAKRYPAATAAQISHSVDHMKIIVAAVNGTLGSEADNES